METTASVTSLQVRANRFDLLSHLADDLAHEVKNPLHAMLINLELLKRRIATGATEQALERVRVVEENVQQVHALIDGLLQLLRPPREGVQPLDIDKVIAEVMPLIQAQAKLAHVEARYDSPGAGALVVARRDELKHALMNLIANAFEAMRPGGGRLELRTVMTPAEVHLHICDSGPGVPVAEWEHLAAPGVSTRPGRDGLGLAVARILAEHANGRIEIGQPAGDGAGCTVLLALPRVGGA